MCKKKIKTTVIKMAFKKRNKVEVVRFKVIYIVSRNDKK